MVELRQYQDELVDKVRAAMRTHRRVMVQSPTGSGKTVMFSHVAELVWSNHKRVYAIAHRIEIVNQISRAFEANGVRHGVIAPSRYETQWPVQVGMVQTVANRLDRLPRPDLLIVDEAHHAVAGNYQKIMEHWKGVHVLMVTATPQRLDGRGLAEVADVLILGPSVRWLIENKFLAPYRYIAPPIVADLSSLKIKMGDYIPGQVAQAVDQRNVVGDMEAHYKKFFDGAPAVMFCPDVASARHMAEHFRGKGWNAASVDGATDPDERRRMIEAIGNGGLNLLMSCSIIDEGTDIPNVAGIINGSPTQSLVRYLQRVGRSLRPKPGGEAAIILDHVGDVARHGMPDFKHRWTLEGRKKNSPRAPAIRQCPHCFLAFAPAPKCPACGFEFSAIENVGIAPRKVLEGELTELGEDWIKNAPLQEVLRSATTMEQLLKIQRARGYGNGWAHVQLSLKYGFKKRERLSPGAGRSAA
jgi:superfamily II DNA or RNA helicase